MPTIQDRVLTDLDVESLKSAMKCLIDWDTPTSAELQNSEIFRLHGFIHPTPTELLERTIRRLKAAATYAAINLSSVLRDEKGEL